jgi:hypothetical protein
MVLMERASSGRPSIDMGIPPRPIAPTFMPPIVRLRIYPLSFNFFVGSSDGNSAAGDVVPGW